MDKLGLNEIREKYLNFFESKDHLRMPSFSLVPKNDPSLLLINAGMAPLKAYFTGKEIPPKKRVTTCQKCIRTPDIERVGKTARHGTFFEMLGNFSFGDYFKKEAAEWAWEFSTKVMELPEDRIWVSIYLDDDEAFDIWTKEVGVSPSHIVRLGKEDNFWEIGTGPCGPCSELYFDRGLEFGCGEPDCKVGCDCDRFVEYWNLVFTQFDKQEDGTYERLAKPNIDTGMGLERLACIMQGVHNLFEVDTVQNIMKYISKLAGVTYGGDKEKDISLRVITDHIRSTTFMVSDSIIPSNEGRGYVLRRLLRRAARHGKLLGMKEMFLYKVADVVIDESKEAYPELERKRDYIKEIIKTEEERFDKTIDSGLGILTGYINELKTAGKTELSGENAFKLYDTYGFPIDLTKEILDEQKMTVDDAAFEKEMNVQRERARAARGKEDAAGWDDNAAAKLSGSIEKTKFVGYDEFETDSKVLAMISGGELAEKAGSGAEVILILDKTPFYAESGGQIGDKGTISGNGFEIEITDCTKTADGKFLHTGVVRSGSVSVGDSAAAKVDMDLRGAIMRNHSATHLVHKALKTVLGDHVGQAGSLVTNERMRFDFTHFAAVSKEDIKKIELLVNDAILKAMDIVWREMPMAEAVSLGATAMFEEKYGDVVRVVTMGDYSMELCGGCHVTNTSKIGLFKIVSESGIAAGVRRIEAITGLSVLYELYHQQEIAAQTAEILKCAPADIAVKAESVTGEIKTLQKEIEGLSAKMVKGSVDGILASAKEIGGVSVIAARMDGLNIDAARNLCDTLRDKMDAGVAVIGTVEGDKVSFVAVATKNAIAKGIHAGNIIREVAKAAGGGGGGRPDLAQAGGKDAGKVDEALNLTYGLVESQIK